MFSFDLEQRASKRINRTKVSTKPKTSGLEAVSLGKDEKKSPTNTKIDTFLQFSFQMDSIVLNLFTGEVDTKKPVTTVTHC